MMATSSMGPNFNAGHPAGMGHPGVAGHPVGPGMPHQPGQQGTPGGMPHQFAGGPMGVPPGAQVNAMMAAMPPGMAAQFQNMAPAQQQAFMQQHQQQHQQQQQQQQHNMQQQFAQNPNFAAMRQQQIMAQHHQQQQARNMMAQQFNAGVQHQGMPIGQMQLTPQQIHALRQQRGQMPMQGHPNMMYAMHQQQQQAAHQQQMAQAQQQAQQQQAQQQHQHQHQHGQQQQQPGQPGQAGQMNVPNMPGLPQQAQPSQAQMNAQQANHPPGPQAQPTRTQTPSQQQTQSQQGGPQPHQTPQQTSQAGTPANTGGHTPAQTPGSTAAQQQGPQPPPQPQVQQPQGPAQPAQPQPGQQAVPQQMQQHPQMSAAHQHMMQSQLMARRQMQQQQHNADGIRGQCLLKLMQFGEHLSGYAQNARGRDDHSYWATFVDRFFAPEGVFRHSLHITDGGETTDKQYDIASSAIARYFHTHFHSGVKNIQLILDKGTMDRALPHDCHYVENSRASLVYWFETGSHLVANGTLRASFNSQQKLDLFEFVTFSQEEYVSRKQVIEAAKPTHAWIKEWRNVNSDMKQSPELSKKGKGKQLKSPQTHPPEVLMDLPDSAVNSKGVTPAVHQFLEIVEVMGQMNPLFSYYHANPGMGPYAALDQYVATNIIGQGGPNGQPGPQNPRTPSFNQFQIGASPAVTNANLPGSPHMGSPAPGQMQAPPMQMQQSQQGTSSSGPSANTSPASNKRRRPSGVKVEDDGSGAPTPQLNGVQNRPGKPATPRMNKRTKVNPS